MSRRKKSMQVQGKEGHIGQKMLGSPDEEVCCWVIPVGTLNGVQPSNLLVLESRIG